MSEQMELDMAHARHTDPETSHEAAASLPSDTLRASQWYVLTILRDLGPCDDEMLRVRYLNRAHDDRVAGGAPPKMSLSGLRTRRSELVRKGLVIDSGVRATLPSGRRAIVWQALHE